jgi:hypothetical protein
MAAIYKPSDRGLDERLTSIDRCQIALLREVVGLRATLSTKGCYGSFYG